MRIIPQVPGHGADDSEGQIMGSMAWIRRHYGVPARRGGRVVYTGSGGREQMGVIRSARGQYVRILLDGQKHAGSFHPTWELRYLDGSGRGGD
jgi:hypothetical protein